MDEMQNTPLDTESSQEAAQEAVKPEFLAVKGVFSGYSAPRENAHIVLFGVALEKTVSFKRGTALGPQAIRDASHEIEAYNPEKRLSVFESLHVHDAGNLVIEGKGLDDALELVSTTCENISAEGKIPLILGGEHTLSLASILALKEQNPVIIHFDAHADLKDEYKDEKICHASVFRRVLEHLPAKDLIQIGIRSLSKEEHEFIDSSGVTTHFMHTIQRDIEFVKKSIVEKTQGRNVYISIDVDCMDSPLVPGTGTPEPNGLHFQELHALLSSIQGTLIGVDVVEAAPDQNKITAITTVQIIYALLAQDVVQKRVRK